MKQQLPVKWLACLIVAPFAGAWIETSLWAAGMRQMVCRPLRGGVD